MRIGLSSMSTNIAGAIEDIGILPGVIKFDGDAGTPELLLVPGVEKSCISLLKIIPVLLPRVLLPKLVSKE